jgi:signal transduction histidine kinase
LTTQVDKSVRIKTVRFAQIADRLQAFPSYAGLHAGVLPESETVELVHAPKGAVLVSPGDSPVYYWILLEGKARSQRPEQDGSFTTVAIAQAGQGYGETPLMHGKTKASFLADALEDIVFVRFTEDQFWQLLACCPAVRHTAIKDMTERMQAYQVEALHREKLITLGTMAAGLMHELHNPGAAAKRSAALLRENLMRLQELSLRSAHKPKTPEQLECMHGLLRHTVNSCKAKAMSSLEQADAEEAMSEWLAGAGVENAYSIGPALVAMGFDAEELHCAKAYFDTNTFSDALNWLGALVSSMAHVCAIEESIGRVSELVSAVKKYAYDGKTPSQTIDVHDSLQSTLTILGHKLRIKQIKVEKRFDASPGTLETKGSALGQVWTNLIDNAADASPANGAIEIATWNDGDNLAVSVTDHGSGIPPEVLPRIFEPFFTTKPQGSGTGLGLEIVHRIVTHKLGGAIDVQSKPGETRFIVKLPRRSAP